MVWQLDQVLCLKFIDARFNHSLLGIRKGDYIIEINGFNILKENHNQIINRIISTGNVLKLLVVSEKDNRWYKDRGLIPRENHSIEHRTELKEDQSSAERSFPGRSTDSGNASRNSGEKDTSHFSVTDKSDRQELADQEVPSTSYHDREQVDQDEYSRPVKPYDDVIEELEDKFNGVQEANGHSNSSNKSDEDIPLNDMTLDHHSVVREESMISSKSTVSERVERFEVTSGHNGQRVQFVNKDEPDHNESSSEKGVVEPELAGLSKSVKEMREELEKGKKKKRGKKVNAAERMI